MQPWVSEFTFEFLGKIGIKPFFDPADQNLFSFKDLSFSNFFLGQSLYCETLLQRAALGQQGPDLQHF